MHVKEVELFKNRSGSQDNQLRIIFPVTQNGFTVSGLNTSEFINRLWLVNVKNNVTFSSCDLSNATCYDERTCEFNYKYFYDIFRFNQCKFESNTRIVVPGDFSTICNRIACMEEDFPNGTVAETLHDVVVNYASCETYDCTFVCCDDNWAEVNRSLT